MIDVDTVIVGGGVAGLSCAQKLHAAGRDFRLVTDRLGGRMYCSAEGYNFGAAYITRDYPNLLRFADKGARILLKDVYFFDGRRFITVLDPRNIVRARELARLYRLVLRFRKHLNALRREVPYACQLSLLRGDPLLERYVHQSALDLVREHGFEEVTEIYCGPLFYSTLFVPWERANAFYYLANLAPIWLPVYAIDLTRTVSRLTDGYEDRIELGKALEVEEDGAGYVVRTAERTYKARTLVLALPERNGRELSPLTPREVIDVPFCALHLRAERRREYLPGKTIFLRDHHPARVLWPQPSGLDIVYADELAPDLSEYYEHYEIVAATRWKTAVQLAFDHWRPLQPRPNLFTIGDYNVCGLEDAFLTGLFAANRIVGTR